MRLNSSGIAPPVIGQQYSRLFNLRILLVAAGFGLTALAIILARLHLQIPGTEVVTDAREIFVLLGAALTGPAGGCIIGILACLGDPKPELIPYIVINHVVGGVFVGWAYRRLLFDRLGFRGMLLGWIGVVFAYYYICSVPVIAATRLLLPEYFSRILPGDYSLFDSLLIMFRGWTVEFLLTTLVTAVALAALPASYREPMWGGPIQDARQAPTAPAAGDRLVPVIGIRLVTWFLLLSLLPLAIIGIFIRNNLTQTFLHQVASHEMDFVRMLAGETSEGAREAMFRSFRAEKPGHSHIAFVLDSLGRYSWHHSPEKHGDNARGDYPATVIDRVLKNTEGYVIDDLSRSLISYCSIPGSRSSVVVVLSTDEPELALRDFEYASLLRLAAGLVIISVCGGVVIWLLVARPIRTLTLAARRIGKGDLESRVDTSTMEDDVAVLGHAFNDMTRNLSELHLGLAREAQKLKAAGDALQESEKKFREMADFLPQPLFEADLRGVFTFANRAAFELFGYTPDGLQRGIGIGEVIAPADRERAMRHVQQVLQGTPDAGTEYLMQRSDGSSFPALVYSSAVTHDGKVTGLRGIAIDITARKQEEEALRARTESRLRRQSALLDLARSTAPDYPSALRRINETCSDVLGVERIGVWRLEEGDSLLVCEDLYQRSTGRHESGITIRAADYPEYFRSLEQVRTVDASDARNDPRTQEFRERYLIPNDIHSMLDSLIWLGGNRTGVVCFEQVGSPRIWTADDVQFAISIADLVSLALETAERKRIESSLAENEAKFRTIIEQSSEAFILVGNDGGVLECNRAQEELIGLPREQILGMKVWDVTMGAVPENLRVPEMLERMRTVTLAALATGQSPLFRHAYDVAYARPDGKTGFIQQVFFPVLLHGKRCIGAVSRDITERKLGEERLRASLHEKELMLKEIHHRVKNNLQVISSLLSLQAGSVRDPVDLALFRESEDRIRSMALIHEKLYQSKDFSQVDFRQYIESLVGYLFRSYRTPNVTLETDIGDVRLGINAAIPCGLIINELFTNALKHAFPDGRAGIVRIELRTTDHQRIRLVVSDNGVGLPASLSLKSVKSLGLHLTEILASQLDGAVAIHRAGGTTFVIEFPSEAVKKTGA